MKPKPHSELGSQVARELIRLKDQEKRAATLGTSAMRVLAVLATMPLSRGYSADQELREKLGLIDDNARHEGVDLRRCLETIFEVAAGWKQIRPSADDCELLDSPRDKTTGLMARNPYEPLPPKPGETTPRFDRASQQAIEAASPATARWLKAVAEHGGPTFAMLRDREIALETNKKLRDLPYGDKEWQSNPYRKDAFGGNLTRRMQAIRQAQRDNPMLAAFHETEARLGPLQLAFDNLTLQMQITQRDPDVGRVFKAAAEAWEAEQEAAA